MMVRGWWTRQQSSRMTRSFWERLVDSSLSIRLFGEVERGQLECHRKLAVERLCWLSTILTNFTFSITVCAFPFGQALRLSESVALTAGFLSVCMVAVVGHANHLLIFLWIVICWRRIIIYVYGFESKSFSNFKMPL